VVRAATPFTLKGKAATQNALSFTFAAKKGKAYR